jgi:hypothetical protein
VSAETYAAQRFEAARTDPAFAARLDSFAQGAHVAVVDRSTPVGEVMARVGPGDVVAILDDDGDDVEHGFILVRVAAVSL